MRIDRAGDTPAFYELAIKYAVVPAHGSTNPVVSSLIRHHLLIPPFQRGIEWRKTEVEDLLSSESKLFGNIILARVEEKESENSDRWILVDGLQRFATATALLKKLYPLVLSSDPVEEAASKYFETLKRVVMGHEPVFSHNFEVLSHHDRSALRDSFGQLVDDVNELIKESMANPESFAEQLKIMFIDKQVAIDPYTGFVRNRELTNTFINLNSQGVDLTDVDLLRSALVNRAFECKWNPNEIEEMENDFTKVFTHEAKRELGVLGKIVYDGIDMGDADKIFPNWEELTNIDIDEFLEFISNSIDSTLDRSIPLSFPYLSEIFACGALPFCITLLYFYRLHLNGNPLPDFASYDDETTTTLPTNRECHVILRACYRRVIDGSVGRIGPIAGNALRDKYSSVNQLAQEINPQAAGSLEKEPTYSWLSQRIKEADIRRSMRIFNACLLPARNSVGDKFKPLIYGNAKTKWQIDHLIPQAFIKKFQDGEKETSKILNLAPLNSSVNKETKALKCSVKLASYGPYSMYLEKEQIRHPYVSWLLNTHYKKLEEENILSRLDDQANLAGEIGEQRIEALVNILRTKL